MAAASIGQVYRVELPDGQLLAVKVQRPTVRAQVEADAALAGAIAEWLEGLRTPAGRRLLQPALVVSVEEFFGRLREELSYTRELENLQRFAQLYGPGGPAARTLRRRGGGEVVTPEALASLSSARVLTMTWIEGEPLLRAGSVPQLSRREVGMRGLAPLPATTTTPCFFRPRHHDPSRRPCLPRTCRWSPSDSAARFAAWCRLLPISREQWMAGPSRMANSLLREDRGSPWLPSPSLPHAIP